MTHEQAQDLGGLVIAVEAEVLGPDPTSLRISRAYSRRLKELEALRNAPKDEKRHLVAAVQRANDFITCVEQRGQNMVPAGQRRMA